MSTLFLGSAFKLTRESIDEAHRGHYLSSWAITVPARACFAANTVASAVATPFAALGFISRSFQNLFTWGDTSIEWQHSLSHLDQTIHQFVGSLTGALVSTHLGYMLLSDHTLPPWTAILGTVGVGTLVAAYCPKPSYVEYSERGGWSFVWERH
jgi:hypothetical protein